MQFIGVPCFVLNMIYEGVEPHEDGGGEELTQPDSGASAFAPLNPQGPLPRVSGVIAGAGEPSA